MFLDVTFQRAFTKDKDKISTKLEKILKIDAKHTLERKKTERLDRILTECKKYYKKWWHKPINLPLKTRFYYSPDNVVHNKSWGKTNYWF